MPRKTQSLAGAFQDLRSDYSAARDSRFRRTRVGLYGTADAHYANDRKYFEVVEYTRDMERNDSLLKPCVKIAVNQQIQGGFGLDVDTGDEKRDADLWQRFTDWAADPDQCDAQGEQDFVDMQRLVMHSQTRDGDCFALPLDDGSLQMHECERVRTPTNSSRNIIHGVELDGRRRRVAYYFTKEQIDPLRRIERVSETLRIPARDDQGNRQVFHVYHPSRFTQTRGVTEFHAVVEKLGMFEDLDFSLLVKQQMSSCLAWSKETTEPYPSDVQTGERNQVLLPDGSTAMEEGISPGQFLRLRAGEKINMHAPAIPSSETLAHMRQIIQIVGLQVGMPLIVLLMDAEATNFSGWRGAVDIARTLFKSNQRHLIARFHTHVYRWKVRQWMEEAGAAGQALRNAYAKDGDLVFRHCWHPPRWPYIQPLQDAEANALRLQTGQVSLRRMHAENGGDFETFADENVADVEYWLTAAAEAYGRFVEKYPALAAQVTIHDFYYRDFYKGGQMIDTAEEPNVGAGGGAGKPAATKG